MRPDMAKVVTEAPRRGHHSLSLKTAKRLSKDEWDAEDHGSTRHPVSRHRQHGWNAKEFSDVLGPLRKYLRAQVGRPWNKVYSELSKTLDRRSLSGRHIWQHVEWEVLIHCQMVGRQVWKKPPYESPVYGLYVHPLTGILRYTSKRQFGKWRPKVNPNIVELETNRVLSRELGIWYLLTSKRVAVTKPQLTVHGEVVLVTIHKDVKEKKQLNKKELKQYGVSNLSVQPIV